MGDLTNGSEDLHATGRMVPRGRRLAWLLWMLVVPGLWMAWGKAQRQPTPRELAGAFRGTLSDGVEIGHVAFRDVAVELGIVSIHDNGARGEFQMPEIIGSGVGLLDYDGDGDLDVFVAGGGAFDPAEAGQPCQLWRNDGGSFAEVGAAVGAAVPGPAFGVACADHDGDGDVDVYLTRVGADVLLRNEGGRFVDASQQAGLGQAGFGVSAAFFDYDHDGRLDLYVANYIEWSREREHDCFRGGTPDYCDPNTYAAPAQDRLYHNEGGGRFADVTVEAGIGGRPGNGLGVIADDFDGDGLVDLYVANDATPALLWHNRGDGTFEDAALRAGCAYNYAGVAIAGMGVACEDLDGDGRRDLFVTNIRDQSHLVLLADGDRFVDGTSRLGVARWSVPATGFGVALFDQDHDGAWDVYVTNGAVNLTAERVGTDEPYAEADHFARLVGGRFVDATRGSGAAPDGAGRGLACGDLDGDGDLDLVLTSNGGPLRVLQNQHDGSGAWLLVDVRTANGAPAIGAVVRARVGAESSSRVVRAQSSYLSSSDPRVHFGLGRAERVEQLDVRWPDGSESTLRDVEVDRVLVVEP
ncbi:MAG: CRTAC1 family protein [bacterium]|nr:CRTAC1 family protein [bacterium]